MFAKSSLENRPQNLLAVEAIMNPLHFFTEGGTDSLREAMPGFEVRPSQKKMVEKVYHALQSRQILFAEAGTGTGKTLAYLIPLMLISRELETRVLVSTETRSLQKQIAEKEIPVIETMLGVPLLYEICYGSSHYLCRRYLNETVEKGRVDVDRRFQLNDFLKWVDRTSTGLMEEYTGHISADYRMRLSRDADDCGGPRCSEYTRCHYFLAREKWKGARLLIVNHSLLSAHFALDQKLLPEFNYCVIDEAHRFPEIYTSSCDSQFSVDRVKSLVRRLFSQIPGSGGALLDQQGEVESALNQFQTEVVNRYPILFGSSLRIREELDLPATLLLRDTMEKLIAKAAAMIVEEEEGLPEEELDRLTRFKRSVGLLEDYRETLKLYLNGPGEMRIHWLENGNGGEEKKRYTLHSVPVVTGPLLKEKILEKMDSVVFTSATLSTTRGPGSFQYFQNSVGYTQETRDESQNGVFSGRIATLQLDSPFDFVKNSRLFLPDDIPEPGGQNETRFHSSVAAWVHRLVALSGGGAFVLFTSIRSLESVERELIRLEPDWGERIFSQVSLGAPRALGGFRRRRDGILLGLATFWQGVDVVGDHLRLVILVRIPFRVPDDPLIQGLTEHEERNRRNPFLTIQLPGAIISIKQGFGRLIRSTSDRGVVAILDPRVRTKFYGKRILEALPPAPRVKDFRTLKNDWQLLFKNQPPIYPSDN